MKKETKIIINKSWKQMEENKWRKKKHKNITFFYNKIKGRKIRVECSFLKLFKLLLIN